MWRLMSVILTVLLPISCTQQPQNSIRVAPKDFVSFVGLMHGDKVDRVFDVFGVTTPKRFHDYGVVTYFDGGLELFFDAKSKRVYKILLRSKDTADRLSRSDPKASILIGQKLSYLIQVLGEPSPSPPFGAAYRTKTWHFVGPQAQVGDLELGFPIHDCIKDKDEGDCVIDEVYLHWNFPDISL